MQRTKRFCLCLCSLISLSFDEFIQAFARIENHYFVNKGFFNSDSFLLDNIEKIKHIKTIIVQVYVSFAAEL